MGSTTAPIATGLAPAPVPPAIHRSWYAKAGTWLLGVGKAIKNGLVDAGKVAVTVEGVVAKEAPTVEAISELIVPGSSKIEVLALDALGAALTGVKGAGDAAAANGLNITLDAQLVAELKAILPAVEVFLDAKANAAPAPTSTTALAAAVAVAPKPLTMEPPAKK